MINTQELSLSESIVFNTPTQPLESEPAEQQRETRSKNGLASLFKQIVRFVLVGGLNTLVDLLILNGLLWIFQTNSTIALLTFSALSYGIGAVNSFLLNKYWCL